MDIWNLIVESNTFNFIIFAVILAIIIKRVKIGDMIAAMQVKVKQIIDDSTAAKDNSVTALKDAEQQAEQVGTEIKDILDNADLSAMRLGRKILADANVQSEDILQNADKINETNGKRIISDLTQEAALVSVELAKRHIMNVLEKKPQYHAKFVEDSMNEFDRLNF